jgi:hypothetical protein
MMPPLPPAGGGRGFAAPPFMPPIPEGGVPVRPDELPLGQAGRIHMPFNAGFPR